MMLMFIVLFLLVVLLTWLFPVFKGIIVVSFDIWLIIYIIKRIFKKKNNNKS